MTHTMIRPTDVIDAVKKHRWLTLAPVVALTLSALAYATFRPATWEASQALVVRDETGDSLSRPGKFASLEDMKSTQETILELAKSRGVLVEALREVGPPAAEGLSAAWPDERALESLQDSVKVSPPKGAEFGKTEIFYLKVRDASPTRAVELASSICRQLQDRLAGLREATAGSATAELDHSVRLAREELVTATRALSEMERRAGGDLAELRILTESPSAESDLRRGLIELDRELRGYEQAQVENEASLKLLEAAQNDPEKLLAAPAVLLKSQPGLSRLKDGLVDAQLRSGQALGTMSENHPMVQGAREAERVIREQLHAEIDAAIKGVRNDLKIDAERIAALKRQIASSNERVDRLAGMRAEYANLAAAVKNRTETLNRGEHELAEARASQAAARASSRITPLGTPDLGTRPVGPGRTAIVAAGFAGGCLIAAALIFLLVQPVSSTLDAQVIEASSPRSVQPMLQPTSATEATVMVSEANDERPEPDTIPLPNKTFSRVSGPLTVSQALKRVTEQRA